MASFPILSNKLYRSFHTTTEKNIKKKYFSKIPTQFPPPQEKYLKVTISQNLEVSKTNEKKNCDEIFVQNPKGKRFVVVML